MGEAERAAALSSTFTADSTKGMNLVLNEGMKAVAGYEKELRKAEGTATEMAGVMNDNLSGDLANMSSAFEEMQLSIYEGMEEPLRNSVRYITSDVIPALSTWVPEAFSSLMAGLQKVGSTLKPLFEMVMKNPEAVGKSITSIAAGFVAMKAVNTGTTFTRSIKDVTTFTGVLDKLGLSMLSNPWAAGAAAITASVVAIGMAIDRYNDMQIEDSLNTHFGDIELSDEQLADVAGNIINAEWLVNIETSLGYFDNAQAARNEAEAALEANEAMEWKARIGISLTESEQSSYQQNIATYKEQIETALRQQTLAAEMSISTFSIRMQDGTSLSSKIEEWASADLKDMTHLSEGLTNLVETALTDGIIDVDEQAAIDQLQQKIGNIMSGWKEAEAQAEMDMLTQKYGRLSGADLDDGTFANLSAELGEQREQAAAALYESEKQVYATLNSLNQTNEEGIQRISDSDLEFYKAQVAQASRNAEAAMLMNSVTFEKNTMEDAYGDLLTENYANIGTGAEKSVEQLNDLYAQYQNGTATMENLFNQMETSVFRSSAGDGRGLFGWVTDKDQAALSDIYDVMKPDIQALQGVISEYQEAGQEVPKQIMDQFSDAMLVGAAAGDMDAAWYTYARQMVESGNAEMVNAIKNNEIAAPQELRDALEIATLEVTEDPVTIDGMQAELEDIEVNQDRVNELIQNALGNLGTVDGEVDGNIKVTVNKGDCLSQIGEALGMDWHEIAEYNGIEDPYTIYPGMEILIPKEEIGVDTSGVGEAAGEAREEAEQAAEESTSEPIETTQQVNTTFTQGETTSELETQEPEEQEPVEQQVPTTITFEVASLDDSALSAAISEKLQEGEAVPVDVPANVTIKLGTVDSSGLSGELTSQLGAQQVVPVSAQTDVTLSLGMADASAALSSTQADLAAAFGTTFPVSGTTDVTLEKIGDNIDSIYSQVGSELSNAFANGYSVSTSASIYVNYSLANPVASIGFAGGGTGTAMVSASLHALGGIFTEPHIGIIAEAGYPESIIPIDGSQRSHDLWEETGRMIGAIDQPISVTPSFGGGFGSNGTTNEGESLGANARKSIDLNINGSGSIKIASGMSKEDILSVLYENMKGVLMNIIEQEILEEGDRSYEY